MSRPFANEIELREVLECAMASLVRPQYLHGITRLRVNQARERSGLHDLLGPALSEMDDSHQSILAAKTQLSRALALLSE